MSLVTILAETAHHTELPMPALFYGLIAAIIFAALGVVTWSYRDVANRHSQKTSGASGHDAHGAGHGAGH